MQYEFDKTKNAWFPRIDADFMAVYQLNYGFTAEGVPEPTKPQDEEKEAESEQLEVQKKPKVKAKEVAEWFEEDQKKSTKVYVSNLPTTISEEEFVEFMSKCGMVEFDVRSKKPKVKLYKDQLYCYFHLYMYQLFLLISKSFLIPLDYQAFNL